MWTVHLRDVPEDDTYGVVSIKGKVYSFGTYPETLTHDSKNLIDVFVFDPATYHWDRVHRQSSPGCGPYDVFRRNAVAYGHCAYLFLTQYGRGPQCALYRFDTSKLTWSRPEVSGELPSSAFRHASCVVGHHMYIFCDHDRNQVRFLDLDTMEWHRVAASGQAPAAHSFDFAVAIGTRVYVCASSFANCLLAASFEGTNVLYYLEITTYTWVCPYAQEFRLADREGFSTFVYKKELYIFGGYSLPRRTYFADMLKYNPETSCWNEMRPWGSGPSARSYHSCSTTGERVFVFGGRGPVQCQVGRESVDQPMALTDLHILHLAPTLQNLCLEAVIDARLDITGFPFLLRKSINDIASHCS